MQSWSAYSVDDYVYNINTTTDRLFVNTGGRIFEHTTLGRALLYNLVDRDRWERIK